MSFVGYGGKRTKFPPLWQIATREKERSRPQKTVQKFNPINLSTIDNDIEKLLDAEIAVKEDGQIVIDVTDLGYNKVLGKGSLSQAITIKAPKFSKSAVAKIEDAGGVAEII